MGRETEFFSSVCFGRPAREFPSSFPSRHRMVDFAFWMHILWFSVSSAWYGRIVVRRFGQDFFFLFGWSGLGGEAIFFSGVERGGGVSL